MLALEASKKNDQTTRRWAELAMKRLEESVAEYLGMDLHGDGSVTVHGSGERRRTVDLIEPFRAVAHNIQLLRGRPGKTLEFYEMYTSLCLRMGRRALSFDGQVEVFRMTIDAVPCDVRPRLRRVA